MPLQQLQITMRLRRRASPEQGQAQPHYAGVGGNIVQFDGDTNNDYMYFFDEGTASEDVTYEYSESDNYTDDSEYDSDTGSGLEDEDDQNEEEEATQSQIPEVDINELIALANELVHATPTLISRPSFQHSRISTAAEARDVILRYERGSSSDALTWNDLVHNYTGLSLPGSRTPSARTRMPNTPSRTPTRTGVQEHLPTATSETHTLHPPERSRRQPLLLELAGLVTVTMFMFAIYRLVTNLVAISAFSDNVLGDVLSFVDYINEGTYYKNPEEGHSTLIHKFAVIIKEELPHLPDTLWLVLTVLAFTTYTVVTSGVVLTSMLFAMMCVTMCVVLRWRHLGDFIVKVFDRGEHCV